MNEVKALPQVQGVAGPVDYTHVQFGRRNDYSFTYVWPSRCSDHVALGFVLSAWRYCGTKGTTACRKAISRSLLAGQHGRRKRWAKMTPKASGKADCVSATNHTLYKPFRCSRVAGIPFWRVGGYQCVANGVVSCEGGANPKTRLGRVGWLWCP